MRRLLFFVLIMLATLKVSAQGHNYGGIQIVPFHYQDFRNGTSIDTVWDDHLYGPFAIGFDFSFFGLNYDSLYIGTNGEVTFMPQSLISYTRTHLPDTGGYKTAIYFPKCDYMSRGPGKIYRQTIGQQPNRKFIVTFDSISFYGFYCTTKLNFIQLELHESTGAIRMNVLRKDTCASWANSYISTIGIQDSSRTIAVVNPAYHQQPMVLDSMSFLIGFENTADIRPYTLDTILCLNGDSIYLRARMPQESPAQPWQLIHWLRNNVPIPNSSDSIYIAHSPGAYSFEVTNGISNWSSLATNVIITPPHNWQILGQTMLETGVIFDYSVDFLPHLSYLWSCVGCDILGSAQNSLVSVQWPTEISDPEISVMVTGSNCSDTLTKILSFSPLSSAEVQPAAFKIYPNPGSGVFRLQMRNGGLTDKFKMMDAVGREVPIKLHQVENDQWELQLLESKSGVYFLQILGPNGVSVHRLVVN